MNETLKLQPLFEATRSQIIGAINNAHNGGIPFYMIHTIIDSLCLQLKDLADEEREAVLELQRKVEPLVNEATEESVSGKAEPLDEQN